MNTNLAVRAATIGLLLAGGSGQAIEAQVRTVGPGTAAPTFEEKTSKGSIALKIRPAWTDSTLVFEIAADTHSGDLANLDLRKAVRLRLNGREIEPVDATALSGHHGTATVRFRLPAPPEKFGLTLRNVGDVAEQVLEWPGSGSKDGKG